MLPKTAYKYDTEVKENGQVAFKVPLPAGARVTVFVVETSDALDDLLRASESSLSFWDNPFDNEDWNNA
jgi:hypothetical protein